MNTPKTIFEYIEQKRTAYKLPIKLNESWEWSQYEHLLLSELYINGQLKNGKTDYTPIKNITLPILNLQHRAEDIELKDVQIYIDDSDKYHLSMLVKKYHDDVFVKENDLDTYFDELNVSRIDLGGGLSKKLFKARPEVVPLQSLAFCSQRDILSAPFGIEQEYSPDQLLLMVDKGWGSKANGATHSVEELITLWRDQEEDADCLKIYEVHGTMPARFADIEAGENEYETRIFIVSFVKPKDSDKEKGVLLYTAEENIEEVWKLVKRDPIFGRALGRGGAEELSEDQVWTNYDMIRKQNMLDAASVTLMQTTDPNLAARHPKGLKYLKNLSLIEKSPGAELGQVDTFPRSMALFDKSMNDLQQHAQDTGGAQDPLQGKEPSAGTPFKSVEAQIIQGMGLHDYRRGQFAKHVEEIYNDWIIPHIQKEIANGFKFLSELSMEEMQFVVDKVAVNAWNRHAIDKILDGADFAEGEQEAFIQQFKNDFKGQGNKRFLEALKGEFKGLRLSVKVSVAGKSGNLAETVDKIANVINMVLRTGGPTALSFPGIWKLINQIIEKSDLDVVDFSELANAFKNMSQQQPIPSPLQLPAQIPINA